MVTKLPIFKGYTVDVRLKEFRQATPDYSLGFISFDSPQGEALLEDFIETLDPNTPEGFRLLSGIWS